MLDKLVELQGCLVAPSRIDLLYSHLKKYLENPRIESSIEKV